MKRICSMLLALLLLFSVSGTVLAAGDDDTTIGKLYFEVSAPLCGQDPRQETPGVFITDPEELVTQAEPSVWVSAYDQEDPARYTPLTEDFVGGEVYTVLLTFRAEPGAAFDRGLELYLYDSQADWDAEDPYIRLIPLDLKSETVTVAAQIRAEHDWDWEQSEMQSPTCVSPGRSHQVCANDPTHVEDEELPISPDAHVWGDWSVTVEPTKTAEGERKRQCTLCQAVETEAIPKVTLPYATIYEPNTSWPMAATVAWRADETALDTAKEEVRPATAFVWLDRNLKVYDRNGALLSDDLEAYVDATAGRMIPAFYIRDAQTASALKDWLPDSGLLDCFVVSTPENKALVKDVADLLHIRGMLDYTAVKNPDRNALLDMIASTNEAHGKVILLSAEAATRENVRKLQSLASTVWAQTPTDTKTLMTLYTNGINGVVVDDYGAALDAEEFFRDDVPSLLRIPFIIGHRGDPSSYVENTLDSARGAYREGVDSVENDIHLTTDNKLFIYHDDTANGVMGIKTKDEHGDYLKVESMSLAELKNHPFPWASIVESNEVSPKDYRNETLYGQEEQKEYTVPTLEEYIQAFKGTGLVHDTEIKSNNPAILPLYKAMVDQYDAWDQFFSITFNIDILDAMYRDYPELSVGALGLPSFTDVEYGDLDAITKEEGVEAGEKALFGIIDRWNATYNTMYTFQNRELVQAARHRGLTAWPWTYHLALPQEFARDYLNAVTGMTCDHPWVASDYIVEISSADVEASARSMIPKPEAWTQAGETKTLRDAELVKLEDLSATRELLLWRYRTDLTVGGESYGSYCLYSNPFVFTRTGGGSIRPGGDEAPAFVDVPEDAYYYDAVDWACRNGITAGTGPTTFSPSQPCTRAQMVTFLWRAAGEPAPSGERLPFQDVPENSYYAQAVGWAWEKGVVKGIDETRFAPNQIVTRAQSVVFLYRFSQEKTTAERVFDDVSPNAWYGEAVTWAAEKGITAGTGKTTFSPHAVCTRAQIVTFLYRALA